MPAPNYTLQPLLPKDLDSIPIQVLSPDETAVIAITISAVNNRVALPSNCEIVEICASDNCRIVFGNASVDATTGTRRLFTAGAAVYRVPEGATHVAVTSYNASTGLVTVTRLY
jgi:hypothetical protein